MPTSPEAFERRIARLEADLVEQGRRVVKMLEASVAAVFDRDADQARWVVEHDALIDKADVDIERAAVSLLTDIAREASDLGPEILRMILTVVKVNNEYERIADCSVNIAERVSEFDSLAEAPPPVFRVMANSVIGIVQNTNTALERLDNDLARVVLASDDTVDEFEERLLRDVQQALCAGEIQSDSACALHNVAIQLERIGDHCTNVAEQVIYVTTGKIVRHAAGHWTDPQTPA